MEWNWISLSTLGRLRLLSPGSPLRRAGSTPKLTGTTAGRRPRDERVNLRKPCQMPKKSARNALTFNSCNERAAFRGTSRLEALVEAGRKRARPIVMTTIAMVAGMLPAAFAFGDSGEFRSPMAIAVIGGL